MKANNVVVEDDYKSVAAAAEVGIFDGGPAVVELMLNGIPNSEFAIRLGQLGTAGLDLFSVVLWVKQSIRARVDDIEFADAVRLTFALLQETTIEGAVNALEATK